MPRLSLFGLTSCENADFQFDPEDDEQSGDTGGLVSEASNDLGSLRFDALLGGRATSRTIVSWYRNTELLAVDATFEASSRRSNAPDDATAAGSTNVVFDRDLSVRDLSVRLEGPQGAAARGRPHVRRMPNTLAAAGVIARA